MAKTSENIERKSQWPGLMLWVLLLIPVLLSGQNKTKLERSKKRLEKKISYTRKLINETRHQKLISLNELNLIDHQIKNRKQLIRLYNEQIKESDREIGSLRKDIAELEDKLLRLKRDYGELIYKSYKARNKEDLWMFVFSSEDFYQAYARLKYIQLISENRREKAAQIEAAQQQLSKRIAQLQALKETRLKLLKEKEQEAKNLEGNKMEKEQKVKKIQQKEKDLRRQLARQQAEWKQLNKKIQAIIARQLQKKNKDKGRLPLTPAEKALAANFTGNKGKLPWPTRRGQIISRFGKHPHPNLHVTVNNKGVDIRCEAGAEARAVFKGKVISVVDMPRYQVVIVQHGSYFTVYSNLSQVYVTVGDQVNTKQKIGVVGKDKDNGETTLHFELWNGALSQPSPQNPESWLL